jgi:hypothetical protein
MAPRLAILGAVLPVVIALSGCGADPAPSATSSTAVTSAPTSATSATSATSSATPTPATTSAPSSPPSATRSPRPTDPCLLPVKTVQSALSGSWTAKRRGDALCSYSSDRGAVFAVQHVQDSDLPAGLAAARSACATKPREVSSTRSFTCVEHADAGDVVVGNFVHGQALWAAVIVPRGRGGHSAELTAMAALLGRV